MDTNRLKKFASEARAILKRGVAAKMLSLGFDEKGHIDESDMPILIQGGSIFKGQQQTENFYHQWMSLYQRINEKGIKEVYEEAAYTWFNRFIAIRILQKNGIIEPQLTFVDVARTPRIVDAARMGQHPQMSAADEELLRTLLSDVSAVTPQFSLLITAYCHSNPILYKCFGGIADYTELLLPNDILAENGFIDTLNHTEFITDEDFASPELIGWLYQFYISERKDEVFAKKGKFEADEIPAATQIFTPNWIVKYMVQNTLGRIYLDNNPWATNLKDKWKYLVEPSEPTPEDAKLKYKDLTELRLGDLACGSGHILNECFDMLFDLYIEDGYSRSEAIEAIFSKNLTGIDLDTRAKQLSTFALLLKACQRDRSFADAHCMPNILNMPESQKDEETLTAKLHSFFRGNESSQDIAALLDAFRLMQDADSLGSIMIFNIPDSTRSKIKSTVEYYEAHQYDEEEFAEIIPAMKLILALTEKYHTLVMNPPYMGAGNMNSLLLEYAKENYEYTSFDLSAIFMDVAFNLCISNGKYGFINQSAWTSKVSYKNYREFVSKNLMINDYLDLGPGTFAELSGEVVTSVSFICTKSNINQINGIYFDLKGLSSIEKELHFLEKSCPIYHFKIANIINYPDFRIIYWLSEKCSDAFKCLPQVGTYFEARKGLATGDDPHFLRLWSEVDYDQINYNKSNYQEIVKTWVPINKGGGYRRWYGNLEFVINWTNDGEELKNFRNSKGKLLSRPQNLDYMLKEGFVYNIISASTRGFIGRYIYPGSMMTDASPYMGGIYNNSNDKYGLAYLNSIVGRLFVKSLCPSWKIDTGAVRQVPINITQNKVIIDKTDSNIDICRRDWDAHETSWDFKKNELLTMDADTLFEHIEYYSEKVFRESGEHICIDPSVPQPDSIEWCYDMYCNKWADKFDELHRNEEELNKQFIEIYGLQDELAPEVPLDEVTILQQGEISIENNELKWHADVVMKQLISYAVGCWMGRYRLDMPGLHIAHPNPTEEEVCTYKYGDSKLTIDDDGIIPILSADSAFDDNLVKRVQEFIRIAFGAEKVNQNISFVEACLGTSLEKYLQKDFWKDHKKIYQNRPIYWLFSSKKGAFQCLAYMHRIDANTADKVRSNYLMKHMDWLRQSIAGLEANVVALSTAERNKLKKFRNDLAECEEYNDRLQLIADSRLTFDLDDGVVVNYAKFGDVLAKIK